MDETIVKEEPEEWRSEEGENDTDWLSSLSPTDPKIPKCVVPKVEVNTEEKDDDCPESLQIYTEEDILSAIRECNAIRNLIFAKKLPASFFGKVCSVLTQAEHSTCEERNYLQKMWTLKLKDKFKANSGSNVKPKRKSNVNLKSQPSSKRKQQQDVEKVLSGESQSKMLLDPNDILISAEQGLGIKCPPSLQSYTDEEISVAFKKCYHVKSKLQYNNGKSLFGKVYTFLTQEKASTGEQRRYLYDLWSLKYKVEVLGPVRDEIKKFGKAARAKYYHRTKYQERKILASVAVECSAGAGNGKKGDPYNPSSSVSKSMSLSLNQDQSTNRPEHETILEQDYTLESNHDAAVSPMVKGGIESDFDDMASDIHSPSLSPASPPSGPSSSQNMEYMDDLKLKQKPVVAVPKLKSAKFKENQLALRNQKNEKNFDEADSDSPDPDDNVHFGNDCEDDIFPSEDNDMPNLNSLVEIDGKVICSVCGCPLSKNVMSFHMRTHYNYQEQKQFLLKRKEKYEGIQRTNQMTNSLSNIQKKKVSSESRIDQLKFVLERLEKRCEKKTTPVDIAGKMIGGKCYYVRRDKLLKVKRDGNYGPVQCSLCGKVIGTIYRLKEHEAQVHGVGLGEKQYTCPTCERPFAVKRARDRHISSHFNFEERLQFATWPGMILEFLERLNAGEDLGKPPTKPTRRQLPKRAFLPKPRGRPRKHYQPDKKTDTSTNTNPLAGLRRPHIGQETTSPLSSPSSAYAMESIVNSRERDSHALNMSAFSGSTVDESASS